MSSPGSRWERSKWAPTQPGDLTESQLASFDRRQYDLQKLTNHWIRLFPYHAGFWFRRGEAFAILGYPELALGDLHKARILVEEAMKHDSPLGAAALLHYGHVSYRREYQQPSYRIKGRRWYFWNCQIFELLANLEAAISRQTLLCFESIAACWDAVQIGRYIRHKFPHAEFFKNAVQLAEKEFRTILSGLKNPMHPFYNDCSQMTRKGILSRRPYPWMTNQILHRSDKILGDIKEDFAHPQAAVGVDYSPFLMSLFGSSSPKKDLFGVVAAKSISFGDLVFIEAGTIFATTVSNRCLTCCGSIDKDVTVWCQACNLAHFCNQICLTRAAEEFHLPMCGRDFSFLCDAASTSETSDNHAPMDSLLLLRLLAASIQEKAPHPLLSSAIARLTANYSSSGFFEFSFTDHIVNPIRLVQTLGIDPFVHLEYDTWVLEVIRHRLTNNRLGGRLHNHKLLTVHRCYSMFNHSCEPNIQVTGADDTESNMIYLVACQDIKKGDEIFVSYIAGVDHLDRETRQSSLASWLGGDCKCVRCEREK